MKTLSAVVVFLLLLATAGGCVGYFEYKNLESAIEIEQQNINTLQSEVVELQKIRPVVNKIFVIQLQDQGSSEQAKTSNYPTRNDSSFSKQ